MSLIGDIAGIPLAFLEEMDSKGLLIFLIIGLIIAGIILIIRNAR